MGPEIVSAAKFDQANTTPSPAPLELTGSNNPVLPLLWTLSFPDRTFQNMSLSHFMGHALAWTWISEGTGAGLQMPAPPPPLPQYHDVLLDDTISIPSQKNPPKKFYCPPPPNIEMTSMTLCPCEDESGPYFAGGVAEGGMGNLESGMTRMVWGIGGV